MVSGPNAVYMFKGTSWFLTRERKSAARRTLAGSSALKAISPTSLPYVDTKSKFSRILTSLNVHESRDPMADVYALSSPLRHYEGRLEGQDFCRPRREVYPMAQLKSKGSTRQKNGKQSKS